MSGQNIAFISHSSELAGAERVLCIAMESLVEDGHSGTVFLPGPGPLVEAVSHLPVNVEFFETLYLLSRFQDDEEFSKAQGWVWEGFPRRVEALQRKILRSGADLVYTNTVIPVEGPFAAAGLGLSHIWHPHELFLDPEFFDWILGLPALAHLVASLSDRVIAVSDAHYAHLVPWMEKDQLTRIYEPISWAAHQMELPVPEDLTADRERFECVLLSVGTICPRKAQLDLLAALEHLPEAVQEPTCVWIVGEARSESDREALTSGIRGLKGKPLVRWLGHRKDVPAILKAADVFVHPAVNDPFPLVVQEAMASGLPVIAARGGGVADSIKDGETGLLVPTRNPEDLSNAILKVMGDESLRQRMGSLACESSKRYDIKAFGEAIRQVVNRVVGDPREGEPRTAYVTGVLRNVERLFPQTSSNVGFGRRMLEKLFRIASLASRDGRERARNEG